MTDGPVNMPRATPALNAAMDQAAAAARNAVEAVGGMVVDTREALFTLVIHQTGSVTMTGTSRDWPWIASCLRDLAERVEERAR